MPRPGSRPLLLAGFGLSLVLGLALLAARLVLPEATPAASAPTPSTDAAVERAEFGLHTGLPLYRPLGLGVAALARGEGETPWQRRAIERGHRIAPLDTLAPAMGLTPEDPRIDPLEGLDRLAVIQPRGLSPADNVALDDWVQAGGRLLLVLDPALTGDYDLPLGDPRRPNVVALIPPVVERWGLEVTFDEAQAAAPRFAAYAGGTLPLALAGKVRPREGRGEECRFAADGALAKCPVGEGNVTLFADAALFEHEALAAEAGQGKSAIAALLDHAFAR